jgi:hypothetical protein
VSDTAIDEPQVPIVTGNDAFIGGVDLELARELP